MWGLVWSMYELSVYDKEINASVRLSKAEYGYLMKWPINFWSWLILVSIRSGGEPSQVIINIDLFHIRYDKINVSGSNWSTLK